jgi:hypothetical protein
MGGIENCDVRRDLALSTENRKEQEIGLEKEESNKTEKGGTKKESDNQEKCPIHQPHLT